MNSIDEMLTLTTIPKLDDCDLKLIQEFHDEFLGKYIFMYKLNNGLELKIRFYAENLPHLLGIHKVVKDRKMQKFYKGEKGYNGIVNRQITIDNLKKLDNQLKDKDKQLAAITSKITCFHLIPKLLNECKVVKFYPDRVKGTCTIKSEFILFHEELGLKLHLGVLKDTYNSTVYVPETFIVKGPRDRDRNRLTDKQEFKSVVERDKILINS
ncbi:hypothetical protein [Clostridium butyricum]|uniref:Phage-Barnase-EndoU-ColicinE5/D-RelE like nuclease 4 domain-containing protein n=1 Tax=Clostridium butyricum TaxID=1492 RepID=A0A6N3GVI7_CLOBU